MLRRMIYQPTGNAAEYADLACNIYKGCYHNCKYCYVPISTCVKREIFEKDIRPKDDFLKKLRSDINLIIKKKELPIASVLLSFISDPYQPIDEKLELTRKTIQLLDVYNYPIKILTKGGQLTQRDFDILSQNSENQFGVTLVLLDKKDLQYWEPNAASAEQRIDNLKEAKKKGIKTWISLEPIIDPKQALAVIDETHEFVDFYGVGKLNYNRSEKINWKEVRDEVKEKLISLKKQFMIHKNLEDI